MGILQVHCMYDLEKERGSSTRSTLGIMIIAQNLIRFQRYPVIKGGNLKIACIESFVISVSYFTIHNHPPLRFSPSYSFQTTIARQLQFGRHHRHNHPQHNILPIDRHSYSAISRRGDPRVLRTSPVGNSNGQQRSPPLHDKPVSVIEHCGRVVGGDHQNSNHLQHLQHQHQPPSYHHPLGSSGEERTRENVGQIVERSYHENGDLNDIRSAEVVAVTHDTVITIMPIHHRQQIVMPSPPSKSSPQQKGKKRGALFSCFSNSKKSIFYFKSPKKDKVVTPTTTTGKDSHLLDTATATTNTRLSMPRRLVKMNSVDSANTISNSSLQEVDDEEFNSSDLVRYMEEINLGIKC